MLGKMTFLVAATVVFTAACGGERRIYKGTLTTTVETSAYGEYVGSSNDEVDATVTKYNEDEMSINFKTVGDGKIKTEMESCTLKMIKSGRDWAENSSKKCTAGGQEYQILKGTGEMSGKDLRLSFEAVPFGTGKTNKYRFEGITG